MSKFANNDKAVTKGIDIVTDAVVKYMKDREISLSVAESCTGGMISQMITSVSGASQIYLGGVCSYTEEIKIKVLGIKPETLEKHTVYSSQIASEMSLGVIKLMNSQASIGVTGIAGPQGYTKDKPVGTVYVSCRYKNYEIVKDLALYNEYENLDREKVRILTAQKAMEMLYELINEKTEA